MSFAQESMNLLNILAVPGEVVESLEATPRWRAPLITTALVSAVTGLFMVPAIEQTMRRAVESSFGASGPAAASQNLLLPVLFLGDVGGALCRWSVVAFGMLCGIRLARGGNEASYRRCFAVAAYAETTLLAMAVLNVLILYARGLETIAGADDLVVFKGINVLLSHRTEHPALSAMLSGLHPFALWYAGILAAGVRRFGALRPLPAVGVAVGAWCLWSAAAAIPAFTAQWFTDAFL